MKTMGDPADMTQLLLPMPEHLEMRTGTNEMGALFATPLAGFLADGLKNLDAIENWLATQAPIIADLPPLSSSEPLTPRQQIYDRYFDVGRHGGTTETIPFAIGQVMARLSHEFQLGSDLGEQDMHRLLDGLAAVLEVTSER